MDGGGAGAGEPSAVVGSGAGCEPAKLTGIAAVYDQVPIDVELEIERGQKQMRRLIANCGRPSRRWLTTR
ncbi:MAG: hypothetical protein ABSH20_11215 [Tepidisphaeraceae bacterium]